MIPHKSIEYRNILAIIVASIWSIGQLGQLFGGPKMFYLDAVCLILTLVHFLSKKRKTITDEFFGMLLLFLAMFISFLINIFEKNNSQIVTSIFYLIRLGAVSGVFAFVIGVKKKLLKKSISVGLGLFLVMSFGLYIFFPDVRFLKLIGYDDHYFRAVGMLFDPNLSAVIYTWSFYWFSQNKKFGKLPKILSIVLLGLSFSRSAYIAFALSLFVFVFFAKNLKSLIWLAMLLLVVFVAPKPFGEGVNLTRTYSIESRVENTSDNLSLDKNHWLFGRGYNFVSNEKNPSVYQNRSSGIDNGYLFIWQTSGIIGVLAFLFLITKSFGLVKSQPWAMSAFVALMIGNIFNNVLFQLQIFFLWIVILGYLRVVANSK